MGNLDLWLAPLAGGTAARITSAPGVEVFAKFSPDGRWLAEEDPSFFTSAEAEPPWITEGVRTSLVFPSPTKPRHFTS